MIQIEERVHAVPPPLGRNGEEPITEEQTPSELFLLPPLRASSRNGHYKYDGPMNLDSFVLAKWDSRKFPTQTNRQRKQAIPRVGLGQESFAKLNYMAHRSRGRGIEGIDPAELEAWSNSPFIQLMHDDRPRFIHPTRRDEPQQLHTRVILGLDAYNSLVMGNLELVRHFTIGMFKKVRPPAEKIKDMYQEGVIGLMEAVANVEDKRGMFSSYAFDRITGAMADFLRKESWLPRTLAARVRDYYEGWTDQEPNYIKRTSLRFVNDEGDEEDRTDYAKQNGYSVADASAVEDPLLHSETVYELLDLIRGLPGRQKQILQMVYLEGKNFRETGELLPDPVSESRVCQLNNSLLLNMQLRGERVWGKDAPAIIANLESEHIESPELAQAIEDALAPASLFFTELEGIPYWEMTIPERIIYATWITGEAFSYDRLMTAVGPEVTERTIVDNVLEANDLMKEKGINHAILEDDEGLRLYVMPEEEKPILVDKSTLKEGVRISKIGVNVKGIYMGDSDEPGMARVEFGKRGTKQFYEGQVPYDLLLNPQAYEIAQDKSSK